MFDSLGRLAVFENFRIDRSLPKYKRPSDAEGDESEKMSNPYHITLSDGQWRVLESATINSGYIVGRSRWARFKAWVRSWKKAKPEEKPAEPVPTLSIPEFFLSVKASSEHLSVVAERARGYEEAIEHAANCGQQALLEELQHGLVAVRSEAHLIAMGLAKYLTEETIVSFVKQAPKGLRLDWVANFTRQVPVELMHQKIECDKLHIFDNYAVLHYDPKGKSWAQTEAEKEEERRRKADPILFGLIQGRRRLYYVGDWVDEFCDLTLDQIADKLGANVIEKLS